MPSRTAVSLSLAASVVLLAAVTSLNAQATPGGPNQTTLGAPAGGPAAYYGVPVVKLGTTAPQTRPARYGGPMLVLGESYVGRNAAEPTLGVDKKGAIFTVASAFDAVPGAPKNEPKTIVERSTDGGRTWQESQPQIAGVNAQPVTTDPYIYVDPDFGRVFDIDLQGLNGAHLAYSDDQGRTYTHSLLTSSGANDHQTLVAGPLPKGSTLVLLSEAFPKVVYYCVNQVAYGACARSLDGGQTFVQGNQTGYEAFNPVDLAMLNNDKNDGICGSLHGHAVTDQDGRLFIPRGYCDSPFLAISSDAGTTFHDVLVAPGVSMSGEQSSVATDKDGNLYYAWQDAQFNLPYLAVSRDHGEHWSTPRMIAPPGVHETNFPSIDVGDPGRIAITFPGSTSTLGHKDPTRPWNSYLVMSTDALSANPLFLSAIANPRFDPVARGDCHGRCGKMYDFLDVVSAPGDHGRVFATAVDTCTAMLSCSSTRTPGNVDSGDVVVEETAHSYGSSADMQGVVIREVSGPALRGSQRWITQDTARS